jgi:hypothetical protein
LERDQSAWLLIETEKMTFVYGSGEVALKWWLSED